MQPLWTLLCLMLALVHLGRQVDRGAVASDQTRDRRQALNRRTATQESLMRREYFYIGGLYVDNGEGQNVFKDQMYVEKLSPSRECPDATPMVFIHGAGQTGTVSPRPLLY